MWNERLLSVTSEITPEQQQIQANAFRDKCQASISILKTLSNTSHSANPEGFSFFFYRLKDQPTSKRLQRTNEPFCKMWESRIPTANRCFSCTIFKRSPFSKLELKKTHVTGEFEAEFTPPWFGKWQEKIHANRFDGYPEVGLLRHEA